MACPPVGILPPPQMLHAMPFKASHERNIFDLTPAPLPEGEGFKKHHGR